jgi:TonB family protein
VDPSGAVIDAVLLQQGNNGPFDLATYRKLMLLTSRGGEPTHWEFVDVHFRAEGGGPVADASTPSRYQPTPPPPPGGVRVYRVAGKPLMSGGEWPRQADGTFVHAVVLVHAFVNTDGIVERADIQRSSDQQAFDREALRTVRGRALAPSDQAHWQSVPVEFWPNPLPLPMDDTPASRY